MSLDYDKIFPIVKSVAAQVSSKFPSYVQYDDTVGTLLLFIYQKRDSIERAVEDGPGWEAKIASTLRKVAYDHCEREKAAAEGYDPINVYRFPLEAVKEAFVQYVEDTLDATTRIDMRDALENVGADILRVLTYRYRDGMDNEQLGAALGISPGAAKKRAQRALHALQKQLGRKEPITPYKGDRRAVRTNASWRADLSGAYDG